MIFCDECGGQKGQIINSRYLIDKGILGITVRRRRVCEECGHKWTTVEVNKSELKKIQSQLEQTRRELHYYNRLYTRSNISKIKNKSRK